MCLCVGYRDLSGQSGSISRKGLIVLQVILRARGRATRVGKDKVLCGYGGIALGFFSWCLVTLSPDNNRLLASLIS